MKAAILRAGAMVVEELPDLTPGPGQVQVEPIACGICGSDLHTVVHSHDLVASAKAAGMSVFDYNPDQDLVMGHELSVRVTGLGEGVSSIAEGDEFTAMPYLRTPAGRVYPGYSNIYPGGYSSQMLLSPGGLLPIPNGLDPALAALTEPMAVGLHAVEESSIELGRAALVVGAGPVGLAVIAALSASGIEPIIAADFSPTRRGVAAAMGAHQVIDPAIESIFDAWAAATDRSTPPVVFDAVGVPGMIDQLMQSAPTRSEILVVGLCIPPDNFHPSFGVYKQLSLKFVLGWSPEEFATSLHNLAEGNIDGSTLVTGEVGIDGVPQAFADLADPEQHVKILVRPNL
ncbi:MAG: threonine dehydrogenase-like Zn-dependent dehydrogenase [Acidimicrobiales bacterium]|jgi:threonine dehydrogenase-like Zn-dependent dehydrogenase